MTPEDFLAERGSQTFNFIAFQDMFKKICHDYKDNIATKVKSKAIEFCSKILFEVGPESRKVKRSTGDKVWKFRFCYKVADKLLVKTAFVCTFKGADAKNEQTSEPDKMIMSVKN